MPSAQARFPPTATASCWASRATGVPIPLAGTLSLPEVALLKRAETRGVAKFAATLYDAKTGALKSVSSASYGFSHRTHWVVLLAGLDRG